MSKIRCLLMCCCFILATGGIHAQSTGEDIRGYIPTENLDRKKEANRQKNKPKKKNYSYIYKARTEGILYGNPCALEETRKMGFEYVVQKPTLPGGMEQEDVRWHNFWVKVKLVFTRSPFWKLILNKKLEQCRQKTGDIVG